MRSLRHADNLHVIPVGLVINQTHSVSINFSLALLYIFKHIVVKGLYASMRSPVRLNVGDGCMRYCLRGAVFDFLLTSSTASTANLRRYLSLPQ